MRIIGGHDYYDTCLAWGRDEHILFLRNAGRSLKNQEFLALGIPVPEFSGHFQTNEEEAHPLSQKYRYRTSSTHAIVCGKAYSGLQIIVTKPNDLAQDSHTGTYWFWALEPLENFLQQHGLKIHETLRSEAYTRSRRVSGNIEPTKPKGYFGPKELPKAALDKIVEMKITTMTFDPDEAVHLRVSCWKIDQPTLKNIEFFRAIDPVTIFQEISMWIGGVIGSHAPKPVEITDNRIKIEKHGFDNKTSFRRAGKGKSR